MGSRVRSVMALVCALAVAAVLPAAAQEQRGSIEGVVKDASGGVLPGVTVEAKSDSGAVLSMATDTSGVYRFPAVQPGIYTVTATLEGFTPRTIDKVEVALGQIKKVDFALGIAGVAETVQVTAESPLIDVRQSARGTNIREEQIELLPKGRDFSTLVTQAPGANTESRLGGLSIDGASAAENRYIVDGVETTDLVTGTSGKNLVVDFLDEVQVKSSGYTAEFGGATGGVINVITKSGANDFTGDALLYFSGSNLEAGRYVVSEGAVVTTATPAAAGGVPSLRRVPTDSTRAEFVTYPEDSYNRVEPGFSLGGPIVRDRAWFYGAYQPTVIDTERTVTFSLDNSTQTVDQQDTIQYLTANQTSQLGASLRTRLAFNMSSSKQEGLLPELDGSSTPVANFDRIRNRPNYTFTANADYVANPNLYFGVRGGYYYANTEDENVRSGPLFQFDRTNIGLLDVPVSLQRVVGFRTDISNTENLRDKRTRGSVQADGTVFAAFGGQHTIKAGVQVDHLANDVDSGEKGNLVRIFWDTALGGQRGTYGYYRVRSNAVDPKRGFLTQGNVSLTNVGLFIQDAWTINDRLTLNFGIRTERETVPSFTTAEGLASEAIEFGFADKLAPRVGMAWDLFGDGRWKTFASWGIFYDIFKLELPRGSFGGDKWLEYYYALDTFDWPTLVDSPNCPPACTGRIIRGAPTEDNPIGGVDFRHPSNENIDPNIDPMKLQEATAGIEHQLRPNLALSARYIHKQVDVAVEDIGSIDAQNNEIYVIGNPGLNQATVAFPGVALPKAVRDYDAIELVVNRLLSNNWSARVSYLWSRLEGNYAGLSQSDEAGRTSPNVGRNFDYPLMSFDEGGQPVLGPLATDRPHQFKVQAIYTAPFGTSVGFNQYVASGVPITREMAVIPPNFFPVQYLGRLSDGRTDVLSQTDLYLQHEFSVGGDRRVQLSFNILNLFNQKASVSAFQTESGSGEGISFSEADFYAGLLNFQALKASQGVTTDPRFLMDSVFQSPLTARFGVKFRF